MIKNYLLKRSGMGWAVLSGPHSYEAIKYKRRRILNPTGISDWLLRLSKGIITASEEDVKIVREVE